MNDEFNKNDDNEVVDHIPDDAINIDDDNQVQQPNNTGNYNNYSGQNFKTKVIIENGPASLACKIAFMFALGSVIFCCFPATSIFCALLGAGIACVCLSKQLNGRIVCIFAIIISIVGGILAAFSSFLWVIWTALVRLFI